MTPRTPRRWPGSRVGAVLSAAALAVGLGACSAAGDPSVAAVVDGRVVPEADVQTAVRELPLEVTQGTRVDPVQVVSLFVAEDVVEDVAREFSEAGPASLLVTLDDARTVLETVDLDAGREPQQYSDPTLQVIATNLMFANITQTDVAAPALQQGLAELEQADIVLNPRYGSVGEQGELRFGDFDRPWLTAPEGVPES